jgi:putative ABC transport system permease protein
MKFLPLLWKNLARKKVRTVFTLLSILVAFFLFAYLGAIRQAFTLGIELAGQDRLMLRHKVSLIQLLPISYLNRIEAIPGVTDVCHFTWFGGIYQDPKNFFPQMPVEPERLLKIYPEFLVPEEQQKAWLAERTSAIAGRYLVDRYGWKIGDRIPIQGTIWRPKSGGDTWEFTVAGVYDGKEKGTDTTNFFFRYDYFDETRWFGEGMVGWYVIRIADPDRAAEIARRIDETFANSEYETKTEPEKAFLQGFANQIGNIGAIITAVLTAVFFTILLVAGNTMAQSVRERIGELGVLKTLGYSNGLVLALVLGESILIAGAGGGAGLALGWWVTSLGDPTPGFLPVFYLPARDLLRGIALIVALGIAAGGLPALRAMRLRIVDALRAA